METGTSEMDRVKLSHRIGSQTGGVHASFLADQPSAAGAVADPGSLEQFIFLRGKVGSVHYTPPTTAITSTNPYLFCVLCVLFLSLLFVPCMKLLFFNFLFFSCLLFYVCNFSFYVVVSTSFLP